MCTTTIRSIKHKGPQKDINNIKDFLKVLNECGEKIPRFVYLDELPPVGFGNMDASALLSRVEMLSREVSSLREALEAQRERERDVPQRIINNINVEIANICAPIPNVHITNHQQITHQHLYDHIHIHREGMRLFAKTIKASTLNSPQKTHPDREERAGQLPGSYAAVVARRDEQLNTEIFVSLKTIRCSS
ncbi:hypothetical protein G5714_021110 [Onychostoma macrolepis]|uniref:Uncharacterized protein n=1 Tax=Onychostoma macrolepis TaxID=369639 RepID=A0A7J6BTX2_9TELE|nr:hypothetical protein G5714_021110 [Onychostoma macrolepis]